MLKSHLSRALLVSLTLAFLAVGAVYAASFIEKIDGSCAPDNTGPGIGYQFYFRSDETVGITFDYDLKDSTDTIVASGSVECTQDTEGVTGCAGGEGWICTVPLYVIDGSVSWTATPQSGTAGPLSSSFSTGPNAVSLSSFGGASGLALTLVLPLVVLGGVAYHKLRG